MRLRTTLIYMLAVMPIVTGIVLFLNYRFDHLSALDLEERGSSLIAKYHKLRPKAVGKNTWKIAVSRVATQWTGCVVPKFQGNIPRIKTALERLEARANKATPSNAIPDLYHALKLFEQAVPENKHNFHHTAKWLKLSLPREFEQD
jgi:hypothetical protein